MGKNRTKAQYTIFLVKNRKEQNMHKTKNINRIISIILTFLMMIAMTIPADAEIDTDPPRMMIETITYYISGGAAFYYKGDKIIDYSSNGGTLDLSNAKPLDEKKEKYKITTKSGKTYNADHEGHWISGISMESEEGYRSGSKGGHEKLSIQIPISSTDTNAVLAWLPNVNTYDKKVHFVGWKSKKTGMVVTENTKISESGTEMEAEFSYDDAVFTVMNENGTAVEKTVKFKHGIVNASLPVQNKTNYIFDGYYSKDGVRFTDDKGKLIVETGWDHIVYPRFTPDPNVKKPEVSGDSGNPSQSTQTSQPAQTSTSVTNGGKQNTANGGVQSGSQANAQRRGQAHTNAKYAVSKSIKKPAKVRAARSGRRKMKVSWAKRSKKAIRKLSFYEVQYSTNKKFNQNTKTVRVNKNKRSVSIKVPSWKGKKTKTMYVRVRAVQRNRCSKWSSVKKVIIRR